MPVCGSILSDTLALTNDDLVTLGYDTADMTYDFREILQISDDICVV